MIYFKSFIVADSLAAFMNSKNIGKVNVVLLRYNTENHSYDLFYEKL